MANVLLLIENISCMRSKFKYKYQFVFEYNFFPNLCQVLLCSAKLYPDDGNYEIRLNKNGHELTNQGEIKS